MGRKSVTSSFEQSLDKQNTLIRSLLNEQRKTTRIMMQLRDIMLGKIISIDDEEVERKKSVKKIVVEEVVTPVKKEPHSAIMKLEEKLVVEEDLVTFDKVRLITADLTRNHLHDVTYIMREYTSIDGRPVRNVSQLREEDYKNYYDDLIKIKGE